MLLILDQFHAKWKIAHVDRLRWVTMNAASLFSSVWFQQENSNGPRRCFLAIVVVHGGLSRGYHEVPSKNMT